MLETQFGIEIEQTGVTRERAAQVAAEVLGGTAYTGSRCYATDARGRRWNFVYDGSIKRQKKAGRQIVSADGEYSVEMVSPILTYHEDIHILQELVRRLRKAGAFANSSCGIHIHLDGAPHTARSLRNFINIVASKNDLFYKALAVEPNRMSYCKKMDEKLVAKINKAKPKTIEKIADIWYECSDNNGSRGSRYHNSRYHWLNLHSYFNGENKTVELRGFNSELHAGKIRAFVVLALALNNQALTQKSASPRKNQTENEKFAMRTYLNRIGFIGEEFKNCREHLCEKLLGNAAWRQGSRANTPRRASVAMATTLAMAGV